ncbi:MAG: hypothetical protein KKC46_00840 [Proteobacteria bacterium]|nr:hypothetical protein [Pseudomonadota bacterium]
MKPEMQTEKIFVLPQASSILSLVKALTSKYKLTIAEEAVAQSHKEAQFYAEIIHKSSRPVCYADRDDTLPKPDNC